MKRDWYDFPPWFVRLIVAIGVAGIALFAFDVIAIAWDVFAMSGHQGVP